MRQARRQSAIIRLTRWLRRLQSPELAAADAARDGGRYSEAAELYAKALAAQPGRTDLRVQRANMLKDSNRLSEAEEEYLIAAVKLPNDTDIHLQLGHLYKAMNKRTKAIEHYRMAGILSANAVGAAQERRDLGDRDALNDRFLASVASGALESVLSIALDVGRLQRSLDAIVRSLPDLAAQVAFPAAHYDTMRRIWDVPAPPPGDIASVTVFVDMCGQTYASLNRIASALYSQSISNFEAIFSGGDDSRRTWVRRLSASDQRFVLAEPEALPRDLVRRARGELVLLLGPGAVLHRHALAWLGWAARQSSAEGFVCDAEQVDDSELGASRHDPMLRQVVDHEVLLQENPYGETLAVDRKRLCDATSTAEGSLSTLAFEMLLALAAAGSVGHVPFPLIGLPDDVMDAVVPSAVEYAEIVRRHLTELGVADQLDMTVDPGRGRRVRWRMPSPRQGLSVIIPTRDNGDDVASLVGSLRERAGGRASMSITVMDNGTVDLRSLERLAELSGKGVNVIRCDEPFNWSRLNNIGARATASENVVFMNDDMLMLTAGWDELALGLLARPEVGVVGAKLLYPDYTIQHAGILFGWRGRAIHDGLYEGRHSPGPGGRWQLRRRVSAVTGAFMAMRRALFDELGGFDEEQLAISYSDLDMSLKVRERGLGVLYAPEIELIHYESKSRGLTHRKESTKAVDDAELAVMRMRWPGVLTFDVSVHPAWRDATMPFRLMSPPSADAALRHLIATSAPDPWLPVRGAT